MTFNRRKAEMALKVFGNAKSVALAVMMVVVAPCMVGYLLFDADACYYIGMVLFILFAGLYIYADLTVVFAEADRRLKEEKEAGCTAVGVDGTPYPHIRYDPVSKKFEEDK